MNGKEKMSVRTDLLGGLVVSLFLSLFMVNGHRVFVSMLIFIVGKGNYIYNLSKGRSKPTLTTYRVLDSFQDSVRDYSSSSISYPMHFSSPLCV